MEYNTFIEDYDSYEGMGAAAYAVGVILLAIVAIIGILISQLF